MNNRVVTIIVVVALVVAVGAGAFLLGRGMAAGSQQAGSLSGAAGGQRGAGAPGGGAFGRGFGGGMGGPGGFPQGGFRSGPNAAAFVGGKVISKDKDSITVSTPQGGSKTVYVSGATRFETISPGSIADVSVGETVTAAGNTGSDGSITARAVTIVKR